MSHCYDWPRPSVTADVVVLSERGGRTEILLIRRKHDPFAGAWALPGGFMDEHETLIACAVRELAEETGIGVEAAALTPVGVYDDPDRDPRGRTITQAFRTRVGAEVEAVAGDDAGEIGWFALDALPPLAFDHAQVVADAVKTP